MSSQPSASDPALSAEDFKTFNRLAEVMDHHVSHPFLSLVSNPYTNNVQHNHFRSSWNVLWETASTGRRAHGMTVKQVVQTGLDFTQYLQGHHNIEEKRMFPMLGGRIKQFDTKHGEMCQQHKQIHKGLVQLETYLRSVQRNEAEFEPDVLKEKMQSWGSVLWTHLDEEVAALGAENMRKHFTKEEMRRFPW